nr:hypothetical protein [Tanacetum cinerariifolium]
DKRLRDLMMMILVKQTEEFDMMLYMVKTDMLMLVAEIEVGDKTADDFDKLACSADVVKSRQVGMSLMHQSNFISMVLMLAKVGVKLIKVGSMKISHQLDISDKLTPFGRECVQKFRVDLELFQFHVIHVYVIQE